MIQFDPPRAAFVVINFMVDEHVKHNDMVYVHGIEVVASTTDVIVETKSGLIARIPANHVQFINQPDSA